MSSLPPKIPLRAALNSSFQASKWQTCSLLLDSDEMEELLNDLGNFEIVQISGVIPTGHEIIKRADFLEVYGLYIEALKRGEISSDTRIRPYFSSVLTLDLNALYAVKINEGHSLVKIQKPVIQLQTHRFDYSFADGKFRSMVMGFDSIYWGVQFSYPHLYQDDKLQVFTVREGAQFPNTSLFKKLQAWVRTYTIATPIEVQGKKINVPIRLGKKCLSWINQHPQLKAKGLKVLI